MRRFYIGVQPTDQETEAKGLFLDDYSDKEELFDAIDDLFPQLRENSPKCPKCGGSMSWDDVPPKGWHCDNEMCDMSPLWSDEMGRNVVYDLTASSYETDELTSYYQKLLLKYNFVTPNGIHDSVFEFMTAIDDVIENAVEEALIIYLDDKLFDAEKHDIYDTYQSFKNDYIGFSGTFDDEGTKEWLGKWMVSNDMVSVPERLESCIDYSALASNYCLGGAYWFRDGYVFSN